MMTEDDMAGWQIIAAILAVAVLASALLHGIAAIIGALLPW